MPVKVGSFCLTLRVKIGYNGPVLANLTIFIMRICLIGALWAFLWRLIRPSSQRMRILRAALLVCGLLALLAAMRTTGL